MLCRLKQQLCWCGWPGLASDYESYHANLNDLPVPKLSIGGEIMYASKELENGNDGDMTRLQFAVKYAF